MICKNCGKEMKDGAAFCPSCGTKTEEISVNNVNATAVTADAPKKKYPTKLVVGAIIAAILIIIIAIAASGGEDESYSSNNSNTKLSADTSSFFEDTFGDSEENVIKTLAISEIQKYPGEKHDEDVFDIEILAKDDCYNYIVGANTEYSSGMDKWWRVLIKLDIETGKMRCYVKTTGEHIARDEWIEKFKNENEYGWGKENHIE